MGDHAGKGFSELSAAFEKGKPMDTCESQDTGKRGASSSPVKGKLAEVKKLRTSQDTANLVRDAINALSEKMYKMAMKSDLDEMRTHIPAETKAIVAEAVDPLKSEMHNVRGRVDRSREKIEKLKPRIQAVEATSVRHEHAQSEEIKALHRAMTNLQCDVKGGQVLCSGFPQKMPDGDSGSAKPFLNKAKGKTINAQGSTVNKGPCGLFQDARNDSMEAALLTTQELFPHTMASIDWMERGAENNYETL